jgi:hypothetical protein
MTAPTPIDSAVVARLREIAALSGDTLLLANGPPHPDYVLLDVCGEALEHAAQECKVREQAHQVRSGRESMTDADREESARLHQVANHHQHEAVRLGRAAIKLRASTPAGIYAKALLVRASSTGAAVLARSLATELVECAALRASLWPADAAGRPHERVPSPVAPGASAARPKRSYTRDTSPAIDERKFSPEQRLALAQYRASIRGEVPPTSL